MAISLDSITSMGSDAFMIFSLVAVLVLVFLTAGQRKRYVELSDKVDVELNRLNEQEEGIKKLESSLREYITGGKSMKEWKVIKQQVEEIAGLPSFTESQGEYVLRIHLSMAKKDDVRVIGVSNGISITIESKEDPPIKALYSTPSEIDPSKMKVAYKGNTLEVKAAKVVVEKKEEPKQEGTSKTTL